jgi:hypothetical protein
MFLRTADGLPVDRHDIAIVDLHAQRRNDAVDRHPPRFDARIGLPARAQTGFADVFI